MLERIKVGAMAVGFSYPMNGARSGRRRWRRRG